MLECPKTLGFWEAWLQIGCKNVLSELYEYVYFECRREICGICCASFFVVRNYLLK